MRQAILRHMPMGCAALTLALALGALGEPARADVKRGVDAWSRGDFDAAVAEWHVDAERGDADALFNLGQAYRLGRGVPVDPQRALEYYKAAALKGHLKAQDNYGLMLFQMGERERAMALIRAASERGDPRAQYVLALAHFNGDLAPRDWVRAYALITLSQAQGLPQAGRAREQMDRHIPLEQRQMAQSLAREIEEQARARRSADLAAFDLGGEVSNTPAPAAKTAPKPAAAVASSESAPSTPSLEASPAPSQAVAARAPEPAERGWMVQLGAFRQPANAQKMWAQASAHPALSGKRHRMVRERALTRLLVEGFENRSQALTACRALKASGRDCLVVRH